MAGYQPSKSSSCPCWADAIQELVAFSKSGNKSGSFAAKDKAGRPVVLDWQCTSMRAPGFRACMESIVDTASQGFTSVEVEFLKAHPEAVHKESNLEQFKPFFVNGPAVVGWDLVTEKMRDTIKHCFLMDISEMSPEWAARVEVMLHVVVTVNDQQTDAQLGSVVFIVDPADAAGDIKVMSIALVPEAQHRGLGKVLTSSIFKILPGTKRLFLNPRVTNVQAQRAYLAWGATRVAHPVLDQWALAEHWVGIEYRADQTSVLQDFAAQNLVVLETKTQENKRTT